MKKMVIVLGLVAFVGINNIALSDTATNADSTSSAITDSQSSTGPQSQLGVGVESGDGNGFGNNNSRSTYVQSKIPVSTAYAPSLTTSNDTCMGSTSVGAQGLLIGLSFGTTWTDDDCITRKDARFVHNAGHRIVALSLMCGKEAIRAAVARAGTPEQKAACSITANEIKDYSEKPIIVSVDRSAPDFDAEEE